MGRRSDVLIEFVERHRILSAVLWRYYRSPDLEDLRQVALLAVWRVLEGFHDPDDLPAIATTYARSRVADAWRAWNFRKRPRPEYAFADLDRADPDSTADIEARLDYETQVEKSLRRFPPHVQRVARLHYFDGLTPAECADRTGIAERTARTYITKTRPPCVRPFYRRRVSA